MLYFNNIMVLISNTYFFFRERGEVGKKERERNIDMREKHKLVASCMCPDWKLNQWPFNFAGWCPTNWATPVRAIIYTSYKCFFTYYFQNISHAITITFLKRDFFKLMYWISSHRYIIKSSIFGHYFYDNIIYCFF